MALPHRISSNVSVRGYESFINLEERSNGTKGIKEKKGGQRYKCRRVRMPCAFVCILQLNLGLERNISREKRRFERNNICSPKPKFDGEGLREEGGFVRRGHEIYGG